MKVGRFAVYIVGFRASDVEGLEVEVVSVEEVGVENRGRSRVIKLM